MSKNDDNKRQQHRRIGWSAGVSRTAGIRYVPLVDVSNRLDEVVELILRPMKKREEWKIPMHHYPGHVVIRDRCDTAAKDQHFHQSDLGRSVHLALLVFICRLRANHIAGELIGWKLNILHDRAAV